MFEPYNVVSMFQPASLSESFACLLIYMHVERQNANPI